MICYISTLRYTSWHCTLTQGVEVLEGIVALVERFFLPNTKEDSDDGVIDDPQLAIAAKLRQEAQIQINIHSGLDMRATVFLLAYATAFAAILGSLKDNKGMLPLWVMLCFSVVTTTGVTFSAIALWASGRNLKQPRSPEKIIEDASEIISPVTQVALAAAQLSACEHITPRKRKWTNLSLATLVIDLTIMAFGTYGSLQA